MKKKYTITVRSEFVEGVEIESPVPFLKQLKDDNGDIHVFSSSTTFWESKEDRYIAIVITKAKLFDLDDFENIYNWSKDETQYAFNLAIDKFPEKFI